MDFETKKKKNENDFDTHLFTFKWIHMKICFFCYCTHIVRGAPILLYFMNKHMQKNKNTRSKLNECS